MSDKHTPSPWVKGVDLQVPAYNDNGDELSLEDRKYTIFSEKGDFICLLTGLHVPMKQIEANLKLIAAAPELLECLQSLTKYVGVLMESSLDTQSGLKQIMNRSESAIKKAKGES